MSKRNYTHIQEYQPEIEEMIAEEKSQREIAEHLGFKEKYVVKEPLKRQRCKQRKIDAGIVPRQKGRPSKDIGSGVWKTLPRLCGEVKCLPLPSVS